ncbi:MAG: nuclear transport factor 2 family protein [Terracidiphilus sp.]
MTANCSISHIDRQTYPGLLSVTLMSGATFELSEFDRFPIGRRLALTCFAAIAFLLGICGSALYAGQAKLGKHENRHQIEQLEESWRIAMLKSDTAAMSALLADDFIAITASGTLQTKEETLVNLRTHRLHITSLLVSDRKLRFYGNTALVTSLATVQGTTPDGDVNGSYRYTRVYVLNAQGKWTIVSFEASRISQPGESQPEDKVINPKQPEPK